MEEQERQETSGDVIDQPSDDVIDQQPETETQETNEPTQDVQETPTHDDFYKNKYAEAQRKLENREKQLEEMVSRVDKKLEQPEQQKYSLEELEAFAEAADNEAHKRWAKSEMRKLQKEEQANLVRNELQTWQQKQKAEQTKQQAFQQVVSRNPDLIVKDDAGNFVGWNEKNPKLQKMQRYLNDPRVKGQPDALLIAERFALADMYLANQPKNQQELNKQKEEIKNLQKKTMVEGGNAQDSYTPSPRQAALEKLRKSGSLKDAAKVFSQRSESNG